MPDEVAGSAMTKGASLSPAPIANELYLCQYVVDGLPVMVQEDFLPGSDINAYVLWQQPATETRTVRFEWLDPTGRQRGAHEEIANLKEGQVATWSGLHLRGGNTIGVSLTTGIWTVRVYLDGRLMAEKSFMFG